MGGGVVTETNQEVEIDQGTLIQRAVDALFRELGSKNAIRFLGLNPNGKGDYTKEREQLLGNMTMEQIITEMKAMGLADPAIHVPGSPVRHDAG
jgi:hypothetical protein